MVAVVSALGTILIPMFKVASDNKNGALRVKVADLEARLASAESERDRLFNLIGAKGAGDVAGVDGGVANPVD